jgi:hypothetical protein
LKKKKNWDDSFGMVPFGDIHIMYVPTLSIRILIPSHEASIQITADNRMRGTAGIVSFYGRCLPPSAHISGPVGTPLRYFYFPPLHLPSAHFCQKDGIVFKRLGRNLPVSVS